MLHFALQVKELVSSNLNSLVESASNPLKMLRLLQHELEEFKVTLHGDLARAERRQQQSLVLAAKFDDAAAGWSDKAGLAMSHKREDLARAALLTREQAIADAEQARRDAESAAATVQEIAQAIADLDRKLAETRERLEQETLRRQAAPTAKSGSGRRTPSERVMDRVATLEKRVDIVTGRPGQATPASVDAEIERLRRETKVNEELAAMKASAKSAQAKKRKTKA